MANEESASAEEWVEKFAREVGQQPPGEEDFAAVLRLASVAAHASERTAAPVACWIAGQTGMPLSEAIQVAERLSP